MFRVKAFSFYLLLLLLTLVLGVVASGAYAGQYPSRTIHIIVPWKAGGGTDSIARGLAASMRKIVNVPVIVTNISGSSGAVGTLDFLKRRADGYTLYFNGDADLDAMLYFNKNMPIKLNNFRYIGGVYSTPAWVLSSAKRGYHTLNDLIHAGKKQRITVGVAGLHGMHAVVADEIRGVKGMKMQIIPYTGGATLKVALLGNKVNAGVIWSPVLLPAIKAAKINVLAAGAPLDRISDPAIRDTKTLKDYGVPFYASITRGIYVKQGTPPGVVEKLEKIVKEATQSASFNRFGKKFGFEPKWMNGRQFKHENYEYLSDIKSVLAKYPLQQ